VDKSDDQSASPVDKSDDQAARMALMIRIAGG
jgi:hypothetical protein